MFQIRRKTPLFQLPIALRLDQLSLSPREYLRSELDVLRVRIPFWAFGSEEVGQHVN